MADPETVLTSFLGEAESLVDTWEVRGVGEGTSRVPPAIDSGELLAITDRRLLWFDGQLFDVDLTGETDVEYRDYTHTTTPTIVSVGWLLFALSAFATAGTFLFLDVDSFTASLPVTSGLGVVLLAIVVARARGESGEEVDLHRLVVESGDDVATIWCEEDDVEALREALDGETGTEPTDADTSDESVADEEPADTVDGSDDDSAPIDAVDGADDDAEPADAVDGSDDEEDANGDEVGEGRPSQDVGDDDRGLADADDR